MSPARGFRLAAVERLRARELDRTGQALAEARQALLEARTTREFMADRLLGCMPGPVATPEQSLVVQQRRVQLAERIALADHEVQVLAERADAARAAWLAARADLRAVEALHERFRAAVHLDARRREQRLVDDLAAGRHRGAHRSGGRGGAGGRGGDAA